jgi:uncharacterized LabA/DUF88 family protein
MFSSLQSKTAIFIDYSNIFYAKYTIGWNFNIEALLQHCLANNNITFVWLYGAYDPKNINQYNWVQLMQKTYIPPKYNVYFKPLEYRGAKNKWNVDTEMWFDLCEFKDLYDNIILFSWDGDFLHPLKKLIQLWKKITICSTRWHISWLINLSQDFPQQCRFLDFNNDHQESIELRTIIKDVRRWLAIDPKLQEYISKATKTELQDLIDFAQCRLDRKYYTKKSATFFQVIDKNGFPIYKNIAKWQDEEKNLLISYLQTLV